MLTAGSGSGEEALSPWPPDNMERPMGAVLRDGVFVRAQDKRGGPLGGLTTGTGARSTPEMRPETPRAPPAPVVCQRGPRLLWGPWIRRRAGERAGADPRQSS